MHHHPNGAPLFLHRTIDKHETLLAVSGLRKRCKNAEARVAFVALAALRHLLRKVPRSVFVLLEAARLYLILDASKIEGSVSELFGASEESVSTRVRAARGGAQSAHLCAVAALDRLAFISSASETCSTSRHALSGSASFGNS